ncbi:DUF2247 family protein (plasmid) [Deinococcus wulumuqiensis]|uniref:DUF2247 family protein n=2 Tax=Deinococcus wulumuqiensis TaxID=980427 RepID=A0A345IMI5_9DEIO|nr:DUF2247 family protein [Deinococcus wulumuqiensis]
MSWSALSYGYSRGWIDNKDIFNLALERYNPSVSDDITSSILLTDAHRSDEIESILAEVMVEESNRDLLIREWACLFLSNLWDSRADTRDPFTIIDEIYAELDYPEFMAHLVTYMPSVDGWRSEDHTREENTVHLYDEWRAFIGKCERSPNESQSINY